MRMTKKRRISAPVRSKKKNTTQRSKKDFSFFRRYTIEITALVITLLLSGVMLISTTKSSYSHEKNIVPKLVIAKEKSNERVITHGSRESKNIALTFDVDMTYSMRDNPDYTRAKNENDNRIINILESTKTKATFFLTGLWIEVYPDKAYTLSQNSLFELANHTYSHPGFYGACFGLTRIDDAQKDGEIDKTQELLKGLGVETKYFRFPGGCYTNNDLDLVNSKGLKVVHWDVAGNDGFNNDSENIIERVVSQTKNGSIIVLHMNGESTAPKTIEALPYILENLKKKGFHFVTLSELLE